MSQASDAASLGFNLRRDEHIEAWREASELLAQDRGVDLSELSRPEVAAALAERYLERRQFTSLLEDQRVQEARQAVANDHGIEPSDVSLRCLTKVACGAYMGYEMVDDWGENDG